ncbi:MAG TPA: dihydroorotate dehydrogenase [Nitrospiria bacterium]|nr:dihydroorotate dehydrogenase [Nitrospiria bacterium]
MTTHPSLNVTLGKLELKNPIILASGTVGYGEEYGRLFDLGGLGAITVKGLSLKPRAGHPAPRLCETPAGLLNAIGLHNVGLQAFLTDKLPFLRRQNIKVIVNVFGETIEEYVDLAEALSRADGVHALELNISCPNTKRGGLSFGSDLEATTALVAAVRKATPLPLFVKLSPNVPDLVPFAKACEAQGADGLSLINTVRGMAIDVDTRRPKLTTVVGGLSGPAIRPIAVRMVWEVTRAVRLPVIGMGGIAAADDAIEFLLAGASAVAIGSANFADPAVSLKVLAGLERYLLRHRVTDVRQLIGALVIDSTENQRG